MSAGVQSRKTTIGIFAALMALTALTVFVAGVDLSHYLGSRLGPAANTAVALAIAGIKASLVVLYFMHVRHSSRLIQIVAAAGVVWLVILLGITLTDYASRGWNG